jgi:hypothetical protein
LKRHETTQDMCITNTANFGAVGGIRGWSGNIICSTASSEDKGRGSAQYHMWCSQFVFGSRTPRFRYAEGGGRRKKLDFIHKRNSS